MSEKKFISDYGYSINLIDNWSEYELEDELNTNGFFDNSEWTGNLRITPLNIKVDNPYEFIITELNETDFTELVWGKTKAFHFSEASNDFYIYYWYIIEDNRIYISSFTIDIENKETDKNREELVKMEEILKTINTI